MSGAGFQKFYKQNSVRGRQYRGRSSGVEAEAAAEATKFGWVREDVAELKLAVATMLNLLVKQGKLSREDLDSAASVIDAMDGKVDGKLHARVLANGKLMAEKQAPRSDLDMLSDAAME